MYRYRLLSLALLLVLPLQADRCIAAGVVGSEQSPGGTRSAPRAFSVHDADGDGLLSRDEYRKFVQHVQARHEATGRPMNRVWPPLRFEVIDRNGNGFITEDELISALNLRLRQHRRERWRGAWDEGTGRGQR